MPTGVASVVLLLLANAILHVVFRFESRWGSANWPAAVGHSRSNSESRHTNEIVCIGVASVAMRLLRDVFSDEVGLAY